MSLGSILACGWPGPNVVTAPPDDVTNAKPKQEPRRFLLDFDLIGIHQGRTYILARQGSSTLSTVAGHDGHDVCIQVLKRLRTRKRNELPCELFPSPWDQEQAPTDASHAE